MAKKDEKPKKAKSNQLKAEQDEQRTLGGATSNYANVIPNKKKILEQYLNEKLYAVKVRQIRINLWIRNEELYNGVVHRTLLTRSNLHIPKVFEGVHNASAKLGQAPSFEYETIPEGDENASDIMKHVVKEDLKASNWDLVYEASKIECGIYGRTVYEVVAGNDENKVDLCDTMAYLISPIAKDTKSALYQGRQFIYKTLPELYEEKDKMEYDEEELQKIKDNKVPNEAQQDTTSEASLRNIRLANMGLANVTQYGSKVVELTSWWTYLNQDDQDETKSELYNLTVANDLYLLRAVKAIDLGYTRPPFVSWGTYPRGITFWCPGVADIYRDPNLGMDVTLNQVIDNNTYRNFGMLFVSSSSGLKQSSIVPRPLGVINVQTAPNEDVKSKVWQFTPPEISTGLQTMEIINSMADRASGLTVMPMKGKGGKSSVTEQAKAQADVEATVNVMKQQATLACEELYQILADLTARNMTKPRKVKIFGYKNLTIEDVTKKNFTDVKLIAKASPSEDSQQNKAIKQKAKLDIYELFKDDPKVPGQLALRRSVAKTFDIQPTEMEAWFKQEDQPTQDTSVSPAPTDAGAGQGAEKPLPTEATALLGATQKGAQANVPPTIKP